MNNTDKGVGFPSSDFWPPMPKAHLDQTTSGEICKVVSRFKLQSVCNLQNASPSELHFAVGNPSSIRICLRFPNNPAFFARVPGWHILSELDAD